jgi:hypothetical protein
MSVITVTNIPASVQVMAKQITTFTPEDRGLYSCNGKVVGSNAFKSKHSSDVTFDCDDNFAVLLIFTFEKFENGQKLTWRNVHGFITGQGNPAYQTMQADYHDIAVPPVDPAMLSALKLMSFTQIHHNARHVISIYDKQPVAAMTLPGSNPVDQPKYNLYRRNASYAVGYWFAFIYDNLVRIDFKGHNPASPAVMNIPAAANAPAPGFTGKKRSPAKRTIIKDVQAAQAGSVIPKEIKDQMAQSDFRQQLAFDVELPDKMHYANEVNGVLFVSGHSAKHVHEAIFMDCMAFYVDQIKDPHLMADLLDEQAKRLTDIAATMKMTSTMLKMRKPK